MATPPRRILVTGDYGIAFDLYRRAQDGPTLVRARNSGAGVVEQLLAPVAEFDVRFATSAGRGPATSTQWRPSGKIWRAEFTDRLGPLDDGGLFAYPASPAASLGGAARPVDLVAIEDSATHFRQALPETLEPLISRQAPPATVVLRSAWPFGHGPLWWHLTGADGAGPSPLSDRLVVIVSAEDLRRADIRVSRGISWERTAEDLVREVVGHPSLVELRRARTLIVTLGVEGALMMARGADGKTSSALCFDALRLEGEWPGAAKGDPDALNACFTAAVAARLALSGGITTDALRSGVTRGLLAMRVLHLLGHGAADADAPALPAAQLAELIASPDLAALNDWARPLDMPRLGAFGVTEMPRPERYPPTWRILESAAYDGEARSTPPLFGKARRVALFGATELRDVPIARFGKLLTADRDEIESLRNLKRLMEAYASERSDTRPLSLAVFGPPGSGKSFGIKQIAKAVLPKNKQEPMEFNLSQFKDANDLIGALHQVRDRVLDGELPLVFWDEFDSRGYWWLQFLLAPMQDGRFQEGQITHPIGRCVFVFAGATSYTFENFGPRRDAREAYAEFGLKKGPDFKSRLHGTLNVLGPNPRQHFNGAEWVTDNNDVCFPVRRAILLRSLLGLTDEHTDSRRLEMDPGLLAALLEAKAFAFGSRSFEKIVAGLRGSAPSYQRSALPTDEVLAMNVGDVDAFKRIMDQPRAFQEQAETIAAAVHARWLTNADDRNAFKKTFEQLDAETKADNRAAAWRVPTILAIAGLELVPLTDPRPAAANAAAILETHLEILAEEEHNGWMEVRRRNGWIPIARTDDLDLREKHRAKRRHDCLSPYASLPDIEKDKDRGSVRWYPELATLAGFKIVVKG